MIVKREQFILLIVVFTAARIPSSTSASISDYIYTGVTATAKHSLDGVALWRLDQPYGFIVMSNEASAELIGWLYQFYISDL